VTRPTARVLALLEVLQSGGTRSAGELAARLGVDERTVRRYVEHLRDLEVPVRTVRGPHGGYRLAPGFRLPPLMLTDEEALAVLVGLVTGRVATSAQANADAAAKLRRVLPAALARRLDALLDATDFTAPERHPDAPEAAVLLLLAGAARDRRPVALGYTDRAGRTSERVLHPYGIVAHAGRWYATGADSASGELRTFRLDRITAPAVRAGTFAVPDGFDAAAHVLAGIARAPRAHAVSVLVEGRVEDVRRRLPDIAAVSAAGDRVRVELMVEALEWVPAVLAGLDRPFTVERPAELRGLVAALGRRLLDGAAGDPPVRPQEPLSSPV
jgi:predicted DNA-binding transcriptional regulator YafY